MPEFWEQLVNTALLGTDKKDYDPGQLPQVVAQALTGEPTTPKEVWLLKAAALSQTYLEAGRSAESLVLPALPTCEVETRSYPNPQSSLILRKLLDEDDRNPYLLEHWLEKCGEKGWIVKPDFLVSLLDLGTEKKFRHLHAQIRQVAGERGLWLAQFNPQWDYLKEKDPLLQFQEGKIAERLAAFQAIRSVHPNQAREMLQNAWEEESVRDKAQFLSLMQEGLSPEDEPFLQEVWLQLCQSKEGSKPVNQEIKAIAARLLLSLPESDLSRTIWPKVQVCFQKKKKVLSLKGKAEIHLQLPKNGDLFFSEDFMHRQLGFEKISTDVKKYTDAEYWLSELLKTIHPAHWQEHFEMTEGEVLKTFAENNWLTKKDNKSQPSIFLNSLSEAILLHRQTEWARAWIAQLKSAEPIRLCQLLPQEELEAFFQQHVDLSAPQKNREFLTGKHLQQWSLPFTRHVVGMLAKSIEKYFYSKENQQFIASMALYVHPAIVKELDGLVAEKNQEWLKQQLRETLVYPLIHMLELREEMNRAFSVNSEQ